jgi:hypothetical protein
MVAIGKLLALMDAVKNGRSMNRRACGPGDFRRLENTTSWRFQLPQRPLLRRNNIRDSRT